MANKPDRPSSRYDVSGNIEAQYVDAAQTILVNKRGITDLPSLELAEEEGLARAYEVLVGQVRVDTPITCELLLHIHQTIFGDLYGWAGRWRTVRISKPGTLWPPPTYLDEGMASFEREVLARFPSSSLADEEFFCQALGHIQGEFLAIHPFREGNARTIKLMTDLLSLQTGRPLLAYDQTEVGREEYINAAKAAMGQNYELMTAIIRTALAEGRSSP